jgi:DNA-binding transcriptional ArsR family regulator|tara:strand:- start:24496 stop:24783 length:288 start_codon:yes stop_codon:yes gene_type:complete
MPASKKSFFTIEENEIAQLGRAYAHPARVRILSILNENGFVRNCDLAQTMDLDKSTIHGHLRKLEDADLIRTEFYKNSYYIYRNEDQLGQGLNFM